jgi:hypothetical protein
MHSPQDTPASAALPPPRAPWRTRLRQAVRSLPVIGRLLRFVKRLLLPSAARQMAERLARFEQELADTVTRLQTAVREQVHALLPRFREALHEDFRPWQEQCASDRRRLIRLAEAERIQTRSLADSLRPLADHLRDCGSHLQQLAGAQRLLGKPMPDEIGAVGVQVYEISRHLLELADTRLLQELGQWSAYVHDCQHGIEESLAALRRSA